MRWLRVRAGLTQAEVCQRIGLTQGCLSKYEIGQTNMMDIRKLWALADLYGCTIDELVGRIALSEGHL